MSLEKKIQASSAKEIAEKQKSLVDGSMALMDRMQKHIEYQEQAIKTLRSSIGDLGRIAESAKLFFWEG